MYKYKIGDRFILDYKGDLYNVNVIKLADLNEFGCDFYFSEKNYVVNIDNCTIPIATYNISTPDGYQYIMNQKDLDKLCLII